jgi:hypothetical protein
MKRSNLIAAAMMAGLSIVPASAPRVHSVVEMNRNAQRRDPTPVPAPNLQNLSAVTMRNFLDPVVGGGMRLAPMFPHNRPLPGWRAVQSRARHKERMRRQRRNA